MIREQGLKPQRADRIGIGWAKFISTDNVFGFQLNMDFLPTRRVFPDGSGGPWRQTVCLELAAM